MGSVLDSSRVSVGAVYDRTLFAGITKYARSQTAPTAVHPLRAHA
jgi:hypothetical protein